MVNTGKCVEKKATRMKTLRSFYAEKHDHDPEDVYSEYMLRLVIDIGEVYDAVTDEIRHLQKTSLEMSKMRIAELQKQENSLNTISALIRKGLGISACHAGQKEPGDKYERKPECIHQSRPRD